MFRIMKYLGHIGSKELGMEKFWKTACIVIVDLMDCLFIKLDKHFP